MHLVLAFLITVVCVCADDTQYVNVKSVKGGHQGGYYRQYNPGAKLPNFFGNSTHGYGGYGSQQNNTQQGSTFHRDFEIGVCYIEVPTASLVFNQAHVPLGNGSRPELSRIRSCCKGYIRNIHNFKICDPVCTQECVNALCSAPDTCTCFPDHVKNLAGFCIPTCPIGCQNGHCSGGECLCKEGFSLDSESKYCLPSCRENCGGIGNCTAPNTCECRKGYMSTPTGNCKPVCERCDNGDCVAPNECRCKQGYDKNQQGVCVPQCPQNCVPNGKCVAPGKCEFPEIKTTTPYISPTFQTSHNQNIPLYPANQVYPGTPGNYPGNQGQSENFTGNNNYPQQPGNQYYPGYPGYPGQKQPGNQIPNQHGQSGQPGQSPYPSQPDQSGRPQAGSQQPERPRQPYPGSSPLPGSQNHAYPPSQGLSGNQGFSNSQGQAGNYGNGENTLYPDIQQYNQDFQTECSQPCINGFCVEGNKCRCNPGYELDKSDFSETRCIPHCAGGCHNGVCSAPNFCICNMGYYKDHSVKGRPLCVKRNKRSADDQIPNVANLLVFNIPEFN